MCIWGIFLCLWGYLDNDNKENGIRYLALEIQIKRELIHISLWSLIVFTQELYEPCTLVISFLYQIKWRVLGTIS